MQLLNTISVYEFTVIFATMEIQQLFNKNKYFNYEKANLIQFVSQVIQIQKDNSET